MSELMPLAPVYEREGLPTFGLPSELRRLYGGDLGFPERCLFANFVSTIDGVVAIPSIPSSNQLISDNSEPDRFLMGLLRACADVVLVGSGTLLSSPNARWRPGEAYPPAKAALAELRRLLGRTSEPEVAIVTASGSIDLAHPAVRDGALVLTTENGAARLADRAPGTTQTFVLPGEHTVDPAAAVELLHSRGHERILTEGGPTLFGSLSAAGLVDQLFLTISPLLAGRSQTEGRLGLIEDTLLLPSHRLASNLLSIRLHGNHLFLRYALEQPVPLS